MAKVVADRGAAKPEVSVKVMADRGAAKPLSKVHYAQGRCQPLTTIASMAKVVADRGAAKPEVSVKVMADMDPVNCFGPYRSMGVAHEEVVF